MSPSDRASYVELVRKNNEPKEPEWNPMLMLDLETRLARDPASFARQNHAAILSRLPKPQQGTYINMVGAAINEVEPDKRLPAGGIKQVEHAKLLNVSAPLLDQFMPRPTGTGRNAPKPEAMKQWAQERLEFRQAMTVQTAEWQRNNPGKKIGDDDIFKIASRMMTRMRFSDGSQGRAYDSGNRPGAARIPNTFIAKVRALWPEASDADVQRIWFDEAVGR